MKKDIKILLAHVERRLVRRLHERPSQEALDRLALFAGFDDWASFQRQLHEGAVAEPADNEAENKRH